MIENLDDNFGALLTRLKNWGIEDNTLVIFLTDNGGTVGVKVYNAGMRASKVTAYEGGTRVPSFWRWPAAFKGGVDCGALTAHIDRLAREGLRFTDAHCTPATCTPSRYGSASAALVT
jgi:arylsulfatase A-like enzyme